MTNVDSDSGSSERGSFAALWTLLAALGLSSVVGVLLVFSFVGRGGEASGGPVAVGRDAPPPPEASSPVGSADGAALYGELCAVCHGGEGRGDGPAAPHLLPKPRDFSRGLFKFGSTVPGDLPSDQDLGRIITERVFWSAMHPGRALAQDEVDALVEQVKVFSAESVDGSKLNHFQGAKRRPLEVPPPPRQTPGLVDLGRQQFASLCAACHGVNGAGDGAAAKALVDTWGDPNPPRDLTVPVYKGGSTVQDIFMIVSRGMPGSPMPSFATIGMRERWALAYFVRSLQGWPEDVVAKGHMLYQALGCASCHGQKAEGGIPDPNYVKEGTPGLNTMAERLFLYDPEDVATFTGLLRKGGDVATSDDPGLAQWGAIQARYTSIRDVIAVGSPAGKKDVSDPTEPFRMPAWGHQLTPQDTDAILAYLLSLQPWEEEDDEDWDDDEDE